MTRLLSFVNQRLRWDEFHKSFGGRADFQHHLRIPYASLAKLFELLHGNFDCFFYRCLWLAIDAINSTPFLDFHFPHTPKECEKAAKGSESFSSNGAAPTASFIAACGWL